MPFWGNTRAQKSARSAHMPATCTTSGVASGCTGLAQCARNAVCGKVARGERRAVAPDSVGHRSRPTREPGRVSSLARSGRTVGAAALAGPFAGSCDILLHTPKRTEEVRSGVLLRLHWEKRDARSDECSMVAATGHQPGSGRATRELGQRHLACVAARQGWPGNSRELDGKGLEVERFHDHTSDTIP